MARILNSRSNWWFLPFLMVPLALAIMLVSLPSPTAANTRPPIVFGTSFHSQEGELTCYSGATHKELCAGQVATYGQEVQDWAKVTCSAQVGYCTGTVDFTIYNNAHCTIPPSGQELGVPLIPLTVPGVSLARSTFWMPAPGDYSYKAMYHPDADSTARLLAAGVSVPPWGIPAPCEQLRIVEAVN